MLKLRICPNCGVESRSQVAYFCHNCGKKLPDVTSRKESPFSKQEQKERKRTSRLNFSRLIKLFILLLSGVVVLVSLVYLVSFFINKRVGTEDLIREPKRNQIIRKDFRLELEEFTFGEEKLYDIVPQDIDFYLESRNPDKVLRYILNQSERERLENILSLTLEEAASFLEGTFVLVERQGSFSFIAKAKAYDFVSRKIEETDQVEPWQVFLVGNYLVVSSSLDLPTDIEKAFKKQILSLGLSSEFLTVKKGLPEKGQIFVYMPTRLKKDISSVIEGERLKLIPETLSGIGFVAQKDLEGTKIVGGEDEY